MHTKTSCFLDILEFNKQIFSDFNASSHVGLLAQALYIGIPQPLLPGLQNATKRHLTPIFSLLALYILEHS